MPVKKVSVEVVLPLRQKILRPGKPIDQCLFDGDRAKESFHLAVEENGQIIAVASYLPQSCSFSSAQNQYRLRGMAVSPDHRGKGLGRELFAAGIDCLKERKCLFLWFNARASALDFYRKSDCRLLSGAFQIPDIGPHYAMGKSLS